MKSNTSLFDKFLMVLRNGIREEITEHIQKTQEHQRNVLLKQGIDPLALTPLIGKDIKWIDIYRHVFRVLEFDRAGTTIFSNDNVKAKTQNEPYGYLLVESPILNVKAIMPIIHCTDFVLATTVFDEPKLIEGLFNSGSIELLVTYCPKHILANGFAGGLTHVLHYVLTPRGTLEKYYEVGNDIHMANPMPEKLLGSFVWEGEIRVQGNPNPKL